MPQNGVSGPPQLTFSRNVFSYPKSIFSSFFPIISATTGGEREGRGAQNDEQIDAFKKNRLQHTRLLCIDKTKVMYNKIAPRLMAIWHQCQHQHQYETALSPTVTQLLCKNLQSLPKPRVTDCTLHTKEVRQETLTSLFHTTYTLLINQTRWGGVAVLQCFVVCDAAFFALR